ncbi:uncharacterized protein HD556DRAFT_1448204 [Suillus plorans]|uniref:Uncharacterized protein n=1 Tax=Suillus plorans TaxID=116603 RepID=A0A9P7AEZ1_9AGAM|nr:uncharacterized protein HD556DRAFT_1448187 [Suillus plorans]XP_041155323.1 uncharacterized protein HD556DRAFT_1448204 [Suillus plorans]KAG1788019.1 hypothetical protein HD556DRAFT_1448187 [Suillus plorans]KAG1788037.1 hypothetical protein HD556DRAFT_1448204 [Suillus plorans]KAG1809067.1 hypothetical protein EV424DRAFT_1543216 [Suillus variegatus]
MPPAEWTTPEQKAFLESKYNDFLKAQVGASVTQFWGPVFSEWFRRFPEELAIFGEAPGVLSEEQKEAKGTAVDLRQKKIKNWFNYRSQKSGRTAVNAMGKTIRQILTSKAKGTRVHTEAEVFSKMRYADDIQQQVKESIASNGLTKREKLGAVKLMTRTAYEDASEDVKALCRAKVQAERDAKASEVLKKPDGAPTNAQYAMALTECMGPISQFMQVIKDMTGWEWSLIGAGPDPRLDGNINAMSYHSGVNATGLNWKQATPQFNETHLKAYVDFIGTIFPPHIRKTRAINYDASASSSTPSTPSASQPLDSGCSQPDALTITPPATTSVQSPPLVLSAPPASTELYNLQHDPSVSFPNVGLQSSNGYGLQDVSFTKDPTESFDAPNWENPPPLLRPLLDGSPSMPNGSTSTSTWGTPPALRSFLSSTNSFPPALQLSPITPRSFTQSAASHSLPSLPPIATPQFTFPSLPSHSLPSLPPIAIPQFMFPSLPSHSLPRHSPVLPSQVLPSPVVAAPAVAAPVLASSVLPAPSLPSLVLPAPSLPSLVLPAPSLPAPVLHSPSLPAPVLPSIPPASPAAETPQNGEVLHSAPEKTLKVKRKRASKAVDTGMQVIESADPNTLRKTGRIRQESTRMAQANQIGQINKRARTRR